MKSFQNSMGRMEIAKIIVLGMFIGWSVATYGVSKGPYYIYKKTGKKGLAASVMGKQVTMKEVVSGIENQIYEAEKKIFDLKMEKLKALVLQRLVEKRAAEKRLSNDQFLKKYIGTGRKVTKKDVASFIKKRKIPKEQVNDDLRGRVKTYLEMERKKDAIQAWLAKETGKNPVEVYMERPKRPVYKVKIGNSPFKGGKGARVSIVEFSDFQCPFCKKGADIAERLVKKYGKKIKLVFKHFPLPFHKDAKRAAMASLCANEQGTDYFWKLHDQMFLHQGKLGREGLIALARKVKIKDLNRFSRCIKLGKYNQMVEEDIKQAGILGVNSTPSFFVNGMMLKGALPQAEFEALIDEELKKF